jgi:hypothetical protein
MILGGGDDESAIVRDDGNGNVRGFHGWVKVGG